MDLPYWGKEAKDKIDGEFVPLIIGNKVDLKSNGRSVSEADAYEFAEEKEIPFRTVSAKTGEGVDEVFQMVGRELLEQCFATMIGNENVRDGSRKPPLGASGRYSQPKASGIKVMPSPKPSLQHRENQGKCKC